MSAWKWKLATAASSSVAMALLGWMALAPAAEPLPRPEPEAMKTVVVQPPAGLARAYPHLADAIQKDPVQALVGELRQSRGARRTCELITALGKLAGEGATAALGEALDAKRAPTVRRCAVDALGAISTPSSTSWLSEFVRDPDAWVRSSAIRALASREDGFARQVIVELAHEQDESLRREAITALVEVGDGEAVDIIVEELGSADVDTQVAYIHALRKGKAETAIPALEHLAKHGHVEVRRSALEAWAHVAGDAATDKLASWLTEGPAGCRPAVFDALGEIGSDKARAVLSEAARSNDSAIANGALAVMARLEGDDIRDVMLEELYTGEPARFEIAIGYFVERGDVSSVPRLATAARTMPPSVAQSALYGLVRLGGPASWEALIGIADQPGPLRGQALQSLSRAGVPTEQRCAVYKRIVRERSSDSGVALNMLSREGGEMPARVLADLVERGGPLAPRAIQTLANRGDGHALSVLARAARASDHSTQLSAIQALGRTGNAKAASILRAATNEDNPSVRSAAYEGLYELGGEHAERAALEVLGNEERGASDRRRAMEALRGTRSKAARAELARLARDETLGQTALSVLAAIEPETAASLVREAVGSGSKTRHVQALGLVGTLDRSTANSVVETGLRSRQNEVLSSAISATYQIRNDAVEREMLAILRDDSVDSWMRRRAAYQIRAWGGSIADQASSELDTILGPQQ